MNPSLKVDISFTDEAPEEVLRILDSLGAEKVKQVSQRGLTGVELVIVCVLIAEGLANLVIRLSPLWKCGVVVDARGSRILTKKNCDLPQGTVLVIAPDGTESKLHQPSEIEIKSVLEALVPDKS